MRRQRRRLPENNVNTTLEPPPDTSGKIYWTNEADQGIRCAHEIL